MNTPLKNVKLTNPRKLCSGGNCPTVHAIEDNDELVAIQGYVVDASTLSKSIPDGEDVVVVDKALLESVFGTARLEQA